MLEVIVNTEEITALFSRLHGAAEKDAPRVVAESAAELTRRHLEGVASRRHRSHVKRNYYLEARDSVVHDHDGSSAWVEIPHVGFALRYYGGTVRPSGRVSAITGRPIKRLAIPLSGSEAEGKTPGDFDDAFVIKGRRKGTALLAGRKGNGMIGLLFALVKKTEHKADLSVLPTASEYNNAAVEALETLIQEQDK